MRHIAGHGVSGSITIMVTVSVLVLFTMTILRRKKQGKLSILSMVGVNQRIKRYETEVCEDEWQKTC